MGASLRGPGRAVPTHLGTLDGGSLLIVVGRSDHRKSSPLLDRLVVDLHRGGSSVCWFETRSLETSRLLDAKVDILLGTCAAGGGATFARRLAKFLLLLGYPGRWGLFLRLVMSWHAVSAHELRAFIRRVPARDIQLLAHSAGGIVASMVEDEPAVRGQVSLGYPFRHPDRAEEPYRTRRLAVRRKPLLIVQGARDAYGSSAAASRYPLSPAIRVVAIEADHDYGALPEAEYQRVLSLTANFLDLPYPSTGARLPADDIPSGS